MHAVADLELDGEVVLPVSARSFRVTAEVGTGRSGRFGLHLRVGDVQRTTVWIDAVARSVALDRTRSGATGFHPEFAAVHNAPLPSGYGTVRLEVVVDEASVEVFVGDGEVVLTDLVLPDPASTGLVLSAEGGAVAVRVLTVHA